MDLQQLERDRQFATELANLLTKHNFFCFVGIGLIDEGDHLRARTILANENLPEIKPFTDAVKAFTKPYSTEQLGEKIFIIKKTK